MASEFHVLQGLEHKDLAVNPLVILNKNYIQSFCIHHLIEILINRSKCMTMIEEDIQNLLICVCVCKRTSLMWKIRIGNLFTDCVIYFPI